jgi:hypothetical protein
MYKTLPNQLLGSFSPSTTHRLGAARTGKARIETCRHLYNFRQIFNSPDLS